MADVKGIVGALEMAYKYSNVDENDTLVPQRIVLHAISLLKEADAEPVRHGRWLKGGYVCGETEWICSVCGETEWRTNCNRMKYCMFCGARMDLEEDDG